MIEIGADHFGGILPRLACRSLPAGFASYAKNVDLSGGRLRGFRSPQKVSDQTGDALLVDDCCILTGDCDTRWARPQPVCKMTYRIHNGQLQIATEDEACEGQWCDLGYEKVMPAPTVRVLPPMEEILEDPDSIEHDYVAEDRRLEESFIVYTIVDKWGHESAPSNPSFPFRVNDGQRLSVYDIPINDYPARWCAEKIRIYASRSGATGTPSEESGKVGLFLYGEFDIDNPGKVFFSFNYDEPGPMLMTDENAPPPDNLRDLVSWKDNQLMGLSGKFVRFSERGDPSNWSEAYTMALFGYPLRLLAGERTAFVLTRGRPAVINLSHDCESPFCHSAMHIDQDLPLISMRGAVVIRESCYYVSRRGLVRLGPQGEASIVTDGLFDARSWENILPSSMRLGRWGTKIIAVTDELSFIFDPGADASRALMPIDIDANDFCASEDGFLYFVNNEGVFRWDAGETYMPWQWHSPVYRSKTWDTLYGYQIELEYPTVSASVYAMSDCDDCEGGDLMSEDDVIDCETMLLPIDVSGKGFRVELSSDGSGEVRMVKLAYDSTELPEW